MRVAALQHDIVWEDAGATCQALAPRIAAAAADGAELVLLSEMFSTGFSMATANVAEGPDGPTVRFLREQARAHRVWVGGSHPELRDTSDRPYNTFVLAGPDGEEVRYDKLHPFRYGGEDRHYAPGGATVTVPLGGLRVSLFVCYDLRFADRFWELAPTTDAYLVVANWPAARREHWLTLLAARAVENQAWVVGVNRVGSGGGLDYCGDSRIIDPFGEEVAAAGDGEATLLADLTAARVAEVRERYPFLIDR